MAREFTRAEIAVERVTFGVAAPCFIERIRESLTLDHLLTGDSKHVGDIEVRPAIAVFVEPAGAHAGADVFDTGGGGNIAKLTAFVFI